MACITSISFHIHCIIILCILESNIMKRSISMHVCITYHFIGMYSRTFLQGCSYAHTPPPVWQRPPVIQRGWPIESDPGGGLQVVAVLSRRPERPGATFSGDRCWRWWRRQKLIPYSILLQLVLHIHTYILHTYIVILRWLYIYFWNI